VVGSLLRAQPQFRFLLVAADYFTKWIEAVPIFEVTDHQVVKFLWLNIVCRFGLSGTIISDNGTNFTYKEAVIFYAKYKIAHRSLRDITYKVTTRSRSTITSSSIACAKALVRLKANGSNSFQEYSGYIGPPSAFLRGRLFFLA